MNRNNSSMDGFVLRRRTQNSDLARQRPSLADTRTVPERFLIDPSKRPSRPVHGHHSAVPVLQRQAGPGRLGADTGLSLPEPLRQKINLDLNLEDNSRPNPRKMKDKKAKKQRLHKKWSRKKIVLTVVGGLVAILLAFGGYFVYKFLSTGGKIFKGNVVAAFFEQAKPLKQDANGRSNILLFGTSEDDPGHPGGDLTDSIMVVSVDQKKHNAFVVSIPRDLHVQYGRACISGYQGKINVIYSCVKDEGEDAAQAAMRTKIGEVLGLDIQYAAHVNYTVLREAVDAVGGITVNIESTDSRGILDRNFDWMCQYKCYYVKYPIGPANLDGTHALALARARGDVAPTYGLSRSNPDRQDNQRKILIALKDKAVSAGVLTNPVAVNNMLETLGNNLRTNFAADEIKTLLDLGKNVKSEDIISFSFEDVDKPLMTAGCFSGDICPNAGNFTYTAIQTTVTALSTGDIAALEGAKVDVLNASGVAGLAQTRADELREKKIIVSQVGNAPDALGAKQISFYDLSGGKKPGTLKKLKEVLGVDVTAGQPAGVSSNADFVVIVGKQPEPTNTQQ
jgi:LCP family protein required for cell wall assembly